MLPLGTVISVFSLMMVSLAQKDQPYQIFLSQGVLFGFGLASGHAKLIDDNFALAEVRLTSL